MAEKSYNIDYHPDIAKCQIEKLPFEPNKDFKKIILSIHKELETDPHPDNVTKFCIIENCTCNGLLTYPFNFKGHRIRIVYELLEDEKQIWIYAIGTAKKVDGFINFQLRKAL